MSLNKKFRSVRIIKIPEKIITSFIERAQFSQIELGGLLIGNVDKDVVLVNRLVEGRNILKSPFRFEIDTETLGSTLTSLKENEDIVAVIHSHPAPSYPSHLDREGMILWPIVWVIVDSRSGKAKAWIDDKEILIQLV